MMDGDKAVVGDFSGPARARDYQRQSDEFRSEAERLARSSARISGWRGLSFGVGLLGFGSSAFYGTAWAGLALGLCGVVAFVGLVWFHRRVLATEDLTWRFWRVNENAAARARGEWHGLPETGAVFRNPEHAFTDDLDLFGPASLFQCISVAHTASGQAALARHLSSVDDVQAISARQAAVRELVPELEFRQRLEAYTLDDGNPPGRRPAPASPPRDLQALVDWAASAPSLSSRTGLVWTARLLPPVTLLCLLGWAWGGWPFWLGLLPIALQLVISVKTSAEARRVFDIVAASPGAVSRVRPAFDLIEGKAYRAPLLVQQREVLYAGEHSASEQLRRFERILAWFELRHNGMLYPLLNVALLWDFHALVALEGWQTRVGRALAAWVETLGQCEALSSLAGLAYDNPDFSFPEVSDEGPMYEARGLAHPLIVARTPTPNDVALEGPGSALLVTGSNMSGKSTLMRAMGVAAVLAFAGGPVRARRLRLRRLRICTSMHIHDSLSAGVSHFYAELNKLRAALDAIAGELPVFFLLDEILHGTNSEERQIGARWILAHLIEAGAIGAVSTHDLELCVLPPNLMQRVQTVHLRENVEGERMTFDYRLRTGPVDGGNALRLMRTLGLDVPLN
jgi:hypothetical protein